MTTIEKRAIETALKHYLTNRKTAYEQAVKCGDTDRQSKILAEIGVTNGILSYWPEIVKAPCGSITI